MGTKLPRCKLWIVLLLAILLLLQLAQNHFQLEQFTNGELHLKSTPLGSNITLFSPRTCRDDVTANATRRIPKAKCDKWSDFLQGPALEANDSPSAVCEFYKHRVSAHFPHAMQQLYRCWSWWHAHPNKKLVLVYPPGHSGFPEDALRSGDLIREMWTNLSFLKGFLVSLQNAFNVTFTTESTEPAVSGRRHGRHSGAFRMWSPNDARVLGDGILAYHSIPRLAGCPKNVTAADFPRVAILNRSKMSKRSLLNVAMIVFELKSALSLPEVRVVYFETSSFHEQIEFFSSVDLLISPHGAQLTGIPFMPRCGSVLEIFPENYHVDNFFGSLAEVSGLQQYTLYLSNGDPQKDWEKGKETFWTRRRARRVNLCPATNKIVDAVRQMVDEWRACCRK